MEVLPSSSHGFQSHSTQHHVGEEEGSVAQEVLMQQAGSDICLFRFTGQNIMTAPKRMEVWEMLSRYAFRCEENKLSKQLARFYCNSQK